MKYFCLVKAIYILQLQFVQSLYKLKKTIVMEISTYETVASRKSLKCLSSWLFNASKPKQHSRFFAGDILKSICFCVYFIFISQLMLYFLHSTAVLSFHIDVVLTRSIIFECQDFSTQYVIIDSCNHSVTKRRYSASWQQWGRWKPVHDSWGVLITMAS